MQLIADGGRDHDWREATEREIIARPLALGDLVPHPLSLPFAFTSPGGEGVEGSVTISACQASDGLLRVAVSLANTTPVSASPISTHAEVQPHSLTSAHVILELRGGSFVSSIDPQGPFLAAAAGCCNVGLWPVLVGQEGSRSAMLAAPIILYDYPRIAPESHGDLFDATEIDEILTLRILTLTEPEKREMAAFDPRARTLLYRTEALGEDQILKLHGSMRRSDPSPGDRVILRPKRRADAFDIMLAGRSATISTIERDFEDQVYVTVLVDDDPGKDLGEQGKPGHRFFFHVDEVEPLGQVVVSPP
ncbi:hypothetical protein [Paludisphaera mucosa]|uniref:Uncharacterized protein n=1 Tax=Paludisphaera mucosa TaxID=3030827 RepID=A0ABT6FCY2_9BACT|nr:hypothetical protein [Paludisphaera mucosa]MDG3005448.1 hypothetical protein [Paludisphaera mucosa]